MDLIQVIVIEAEYLLHVGPALHRGAGEENHELQDPGLDDVDFPSAGEENVAEDFVEQFLRALLVAEGDQPEKVRSFCSG